MQSIQLHLDRNVLRVIKLALELMLVEEALHVKLVRLEKVFQSAKEVLYCVFRAHQDFMLMIQMENYNAIRVQKENIQILPQAHFAEIVIFQLVLIFPVHV
jgi:hypothetical protein